MKTMLTFFVVAIVLTVSGLADESSFPLKDLGPTIDEILGSQKPEKTDHASWSERWLGSHDAAELD